MGLRLKERGDGEPLMRVIRDLGLGLMNIGVEIWVSHMNVVGVVRN